MNLRLEVRCPLSCVMITRISCRRYPQTLQQSVLFDAPELLWVPPMRGVWSISIHQPDFLSRRQVPFRACSRLLTSFVLQVEIMSFQLGCRGWKSQPSSTQKGHLCRRCYSSMLALLHRLFLVEESGLVRLPICTLSSLFFHCIKFSARLGVVHRVCTVFHLMTGQ